MAKSIASLTEDPDPVLSNYKATHKLCTPVPRHRMPLSAYPGQQQHMWYPYTCADSTFIHVK